MEVVVVLVGVGSGGGGDGAGCGCCCWLVDAGVAVGAVGGGGCCRSWQLVPAGVCSCVYLFVCLFDMIKCCLVDFVGVIICLLV